MRFLCASIFAATLLAAAPGLTGTAHADTPSHPFGLGLMVGSPTGLSGKLYLNRPMALAFGVGETVGPYYDNALHIHVDVLWHPAVLANSENFALPFYLGVGGVLEHWYGDYYDNAGRLVYYDAESHVGVRAPFGLVMDFKKAPVDLFLELALVVDFIHLHPAAAPYYRNDYVNLEGAMGVRYYF